MQHIFRTIAVILLICALAWLGSASLRDTEKLGTHAEDIAVTETFSTASGPPPTPLSATSVSTTTPSLRVAQQVSTPGALLKAPTTAKTPITSLPRVEALNQADIMTLTNKERNLEGLPPLAFNATLATIARVKAEDMIARQYFAHVSPSGVDVAGLAPQYGYTFLTIGENLALGDFTSSKEVVAGWMNSPGHRANILGKQYTEIGVAAIVGDFEGRPVWFAVQEFGRPQSDCAPADPALKQQIIIYRGELVALESTLSNLKKEIDATTNDQNSYNAKVKDYNTIVVLYNTTMNTTKMAITRYNTLVDAYNVCIAPR